MSIYVGDKKAKLYRGDYGPAQFYKGDVKIAGYTDGGKVGTQIGGVDTYNDALLPTIEGNSEQTVTAQGKNLLDSLAYTRTTRDFKIAVSAGDYIQTTFNGNDLSTGGIIVGTTYSSRFLDANKATVLSQIQSGVHVTEEQAKIITTLRVNWADAYYTGTSPTIVSQLEVGKTRTPYEPFVPNSPSPDYPSPIRSSENFDVVSCGRNLLNCSGHKDRLDTTATWNPDIGTLLVNGKWFTSVPITLEPDTDYYFSAIREGATVFSSGVVSVYVATGIATGDQVRYIGVGNAGFRTRPVITEYQILLYAAGGTQGECTFRNTSVSKGISESPYAPYHATTAHITDPLRSVGNVSDSIEVSEGKVEVVRRCAQYIADGVIKPGFIPDYTSPQCAGFVIGGIQGSRYTTRALCSHISKFSSTILASQTTTEEASYVGGYAPNFVNLYFKIRKSLFQGWQESWTNAQKVEGIKQWLIDQKTAGTPVITQYILYEPTRTDITATHLGQALLALRTYPHYTQVYTNATLPPTLRARIKEMNKSGSVDM